MARKARGKATHPDVGIDRTKDVLDKAAQTAKMLEGFNVDLPEEEQAEEPPKELGDLRELIFLGAKSRTVKYGNFIFKISTLPTEEKSELIRDLGMAGRDVAIYIRPFTLARAIRSINGVPLEDVYELFGGESLDDEPELDVTDKRLFVLDKLQSTLTEKIFKVYEELVEESEATFNVDSKEDKEKLKN